MVASYTWGNTMKTVVMAACAAAFAIAAPARAAGDYVSIVQETVIAAPAATAWNKLKGYCDIGAWLKAPCEITSGKDGELGAVRKIAGRIEEVIVATGPMSYTYADVDPKILYHGTVEIRPAGKSSSTLVYTLFYDQASIPAEQREANRTRRQQMFAGVMATMKGVAEAK